MAVKIKGNYGPTFRNISSSISGLKTNSQTAEVTASLSVDTIDTNKLKKLRTEFPKEVEDAHMETMAYIAEELEIALGEAMENKAWQWDYGDGDIVDTGALRDSLKITITPSNFRIYYGEQYAGIVHYGGYIFPYGNPRVIIYMPPRPWIDSVLNGGGPVPQFDFEGIYTIRFNKLLAEKIKPLT